MSSFLSKLTIPYRQQPADGGFSTEHKDHRPMVGSSSLEREIRRSLDDTSLHSTPSDGEFIASMARRLAQLEQQLLTRCKEIVEKDEKIKVLEEKMAVMEASRRAQTSCVCGRLECNSVGLMSRFWSSF